MGVRQESGTPVDVGDVPPGSTDRVRCSFERVDGAWYVVAESTGGTLVERQGHRHVVHGRYRLQDQDEVLIPARLLAGEALWWRLRLTDPLAPADQPRLPETSDLPDAEYDFATATLIVAQGGRRREISPLGPRRQRLVRYMASRNAANGGTPVACPHEDLIRAVWGPPETWPPGRAFTRINLVDLVSELRKQLGPHRHLVETIAGIGYLLRTRCSGGSTFTTAPGGRAGGGPG